MQNVNYLHMTPSERADYQRKLKEASIRSAQRRSLPSHSSSVVSHSSSTKKREILRREEQVEEMRLLQKSLPLYIPIIETIID